MSVDGRAVVAFQHDETVPSCQNRGRVWQLYAVVEDDLITMPRPGVCLLCGCEPVPLTTVESVRIRLAAR